MHIYEVKTVTITLNSRERAALKVIAQVFESIPNSSRDWPESHDVAKELGFSL